MVQNYKKKLKIYGNGKKSFRLIFKMSEQKEIKDFEKNWVIARLISQQFNLNWIGIKVRTHVYNVAIQQ